MKKSWFIAVGIVCLTVCGCIFHDDDNRTDEKQDRKSGAGIGEIARAYMPMKPGQKWIYDQTYTTYQDCEVYVHNQTRRMGCATKFNVSGTTYGHIQDYVFYNADQVYYYDGNDVYYVNTDIFNREMFRNIPIMHKMTKLTEIIHKPDQEYLYFRFGIEKDESWTIENERWTPSGDDLNKYDKMIISRG